MVSCTPSPYTLVLGRLAEGPTRREELDRLAQGLYGAGSSCWSMEDYRVVLGFLLYTGMVAEEGGVLRLSLRDPHDADYAEAARGTLHTAGVVAWRG